MALPPDQTSMALFCDFENVALGVRETHHEKFDIKLVLERLLVKGSIVVKKAYCDWDRYRSFKGQMHENNFELIEIPHVRQSGKNSADIRMVVDALDLCYTKSHVNTFVIISGDSDFSPLVSKLRENAKQVIGVGVKQSTSDLLTANCDEFIFYDDLVRSSRRGSPPAPAPEGRKGPSPEEERKREETLKRRAKGVELAVETLEALISERGDGSKIWSSVLKEAIKRRRPDFNESYFGFRGFSHLLEDAQARGLLELARDEKSNVYITRTATPVPVVAEPAGAPAAAAGPAADVLPLTYRAGEAEEQRTGRGRTRGGRGRGRNGGAERHDFEPAVAVDAAAEAHAQAPLEPMAAEEDDDAAERFADAARASQSRRAPGADADAAEERDLVDALLDAQEPAPGPETYASEATAAAQDAQAAREATAARGPRGGRGGRGRGARPAAAEAPAETPAETPAEAPAAPAAADADAAPDATADEAPARRRRGTPRKTAAASSASSASPASPAEAPAPRAPAKKGARPRRAAKAG
jgi:uncharacterized protein (TIGR00288 family)